VMLIVPSPLAVTWGGLEGAVWPLAMLTVVGDTLAMDEFPLASVMVTPPEGAGEDRLTASAVDWPTARLTLAGRTIFPSVATVTLTVVLPTPVPLAVIVAPPGVTPVTGTVTDVAFVPKLTVAGTVAFADEELRLMVSPVEGAGAERFSVRF